MKTETIKQKPESSLKSIVRSLHHRNFRLFFSGQSISLVGTWMQRIALGWLVYRLTNSAFLLGLVGFVGQFPTFLLTPFAGVLADRLNRHRMVIATQTMAMIQASILAFLVLTNLIQNSISYGKLGGRTIISFSSHSVYRHLVEIEDDGMGIEPDDIPRLFERFYRVDKARSRSMGGTGLGLAIVKHIVQAHEGEVTVESRLGEGSTFSIYLP